MSVLDAELHVEVYGEGPVLLLLHGFGGSARNFRPQARALRERWSVVLPDVRGHARSPAPADPEAYTAERLVGDVGRVLDRVGAERAVVGGLSMGAAIALQFALAHPERVRGLVVASLPAAKEGGGIAAVATRFADAIERDGLEAAGAEFAWGPKAGFDPAGASLVRQGFLEHSPQALACTLRAFLARLPTLELLAPRLSVLKLPTLVVAGERDGVSRGPCERLAGLIPGTELRLIRNAGHVVNLEAPAAFNAVLSRFLDALPGTPG
jgi:pimeloyl-ACP methyl ester carboxylesterase